MARTRPHQGLRRSRCPDATPIEYTWPPEYTSRLAPCDRLDASISPPGASREGPGHEQSAAAPQHGEVVGIDGEAEPGLGVRGQATEQGVGCLDHLSALLTDEVPVGRTGQVVRRRPVPEVGVDDDAQSFQLVQVAIDG